MVLRANLAKDYYRLRTGVPFWLRIWRPGGGFLAFGERLRSESGAVPTRPPVIRQVSPQPIASRALALRQILPAASSDAAPRTERRIVGIDPGLATTGYGVIALDGSRIRLVEGGTIRPLDRRAPLERRLAAIYSDVDALLREVLPVVVAIEDLYMRYERPRTAILMGHARGVIALACGQLGIPVRTLTATSVKRSLTGEGRASKVQVQRAVASVLALPEVPHPADVADALAIALACANTLRAER